MCMIFLSLVITGLLLTGKVPISLLPDIDVPQIVIKLDYHNMPATMMEEQILKPLREQLINTKDLKDIESEATHHTGMLYLTFEYGTRMDLAYIEVNERLDRLSASLPKGMERPMVARVNTSDIPVVRIQVIPRSGASAIEASALCENVLKKRLEQLPGVSLADINGKSFKSIYMEPDEGQLQALGVERSALFETVQKSQYTPGSIMLQDGIYSYFMRLDESVYTLEEMKRLPVKINGQVMPLDRLASFKEAITPPVGYHLYNGQEGLVITVQKQPGCRMSDLMPEIKSLVGSFKSEYPQLAFTLTQDQSFLLDASIDNLYQDVIYGGIFTILLLFLLMGNWLSPILMSISIPISLVLTVIFFYLFHISFNIISLSGLALGIGMLIDNAIVVIDNINRKRDSGLNIEDSSVTGAYEVAVPVFSQVLTTVAVYLPLILLSGFAGALVYDQSIALTISLGVSLLVSFLLLPMLYNKLAGYNLYKKAGETWAYRYIAAGYHRMVTGILKHKQRYMFIAVLVMPLGLLCLFDIPISALPAIEQKESLILIDWNEPIDAQENLSRTKELLSIMKGKVTETETDIGIQQYFHQQYNNSIQKAAIYFRCNTSKSNIDMGAAINKWLHLHYPELIVQIIDAPNAFTQLFNSSDAYFSVRCRSSLQQTQSLMKALNGYHFEPGPELIQEPFISFNIDYQKLNLYNISKSDIENTLKELAGQYPVSAIQQTGETESILLKNDKASLSHIMDARIKGKGQQHYPLKEFITVQFDEQQKYIAADKTGPYHALLFNEGQDIKILEQKIARLAKANNLKVDFSGKYYENSEHMKLLWLIFLIVLCLLYFILAIQYEHLILPFIVMLTIPLGISGGLFLLWITGDSLNVMAAIGFIVVLGLIVDDPILKVQTLVTLEKKYLAMGCELNDDLIKKIIHEAGDICLRPLLMVSLTTSLAMVPVLFIGGIGNDLQRSMAIVIIGGLTIGTFFTTWFIPLAYFQVLKWKMGK